MVLSKIFISDLMYIWILNCDSFRPLPRQPESNTTLSSDKNSYRFRRKLGNISKIVSEHGQEIPQSQNADNPTAPRGEPLNHHETLERQTKQSNQLSLPLQDDCNTRTDIK